MKRDFSLTGAGWITGVLISGLMAHNIAIQEAVLIGIGLAMIIGSRFGLFGKTK